MKNEILIIPDVHGRRFWRKPVLEEDWLKIVFLGDYLDPYPEENISFEDAFSEFCDIICIKRNNPQKVVLLLGNHDCHYWWQMDEPYCRYSEKYANLVHHIMLQREVYFKLIYTHDIQGTKYIFSHAGVTQNWIYDNRLKFNTYEDLNRLIVLPDANILNQVGFYRGGLDFFGSPVWTDLREWSDESPKQGEYQIFGHTWMVKPFITDYLACLDCERTFKLNVDTKEITEVTNN